MNEPVVSVVVRLFAAARERAGRSQILVDLSRDATVGDLRQAIATQHPALIDVLAVSRIAVGDEYADVAESIRLDLPLAVIPPVSGG